MFRTSENFDSDAPYTRDAATSPREPRRSIFDAGEDIGTLMPVYREIAQRLSRNAYTSYGATL